jgi:hypothetical protein
LCRGVLNDFLSNEDRQAAWVAFAEWLRPGGVLIADVRDWEPTASRYRISPTVIRSIETHAGELHFESITRLSPETHRLEIHERFSGPATEGVDIASDFAMRCWTADEIRKSALTAGFRMVTCMKNDEYAGAADRLVVVAER